MAFENTAKLLGSLVSNDRAAIENLRRTLENELNQELNKRASNGQEFKTLKPAKAEYMQGFSSVDLEKRMTALEQTVQAMGSTLAGISEFEFHEYSNRTADEQDNTSLHDRLTNLELGFSTLVDAVKEAAKAPSDLPDTSSSEQDASQKKDADTGNKGGSDKNGEDEGDDEDNGKPASGSAHSPDGGAAGTGSQGHDPVVGGSANASPVAATPAFGKVNSDTAVTAAPVEIAPGTGQFVDPHATNPAAVATGAPAPVSGSASQPGGDTSEVKPDTVPNSAEAQRTPPQPTAANIASPGAFDPASARANPAPFANTEQDAPKAPIINAVPGKGPAPSDAVPVSANTSAAGGVGQAKPSDPTSSS